MSYCVLLCLLYQKESANKRYRKKKKKKYREQSYFTEYRQPKWWKPHTEELDDTAIPHVKIKITEIMHEKKPNTAIP